MFVTRHQIAQTRDSALLNLLGLSSVCIDASQRMSDLMAEASRKRLDHGSQHLDVLMRGEFDSIAAVGKSYLLDQVQATQFVDQIYEIVSNTHKAMIETAEAQIRIFDEIVFAGIDRAKNFSPWEAEIALGAMRSTLVSAESTLRGMSTAAIQTVELAEQEVRQFSESFAEKPQVSSNTPLLEGK